MYYQIKALVIQYMCDGLKLERMIQMSELLNAITSDNLILLCVIMGVIALILAISVSIEVYSNNKKYKKELKEREELMEEKKLNIKESEDIKYVDEEDTEIEKTKAKIELANLREKLKKEEEEKKKLLEMNLALSRKQNEEEKVETEIKKEDVIEPLEDNKEEKVEKREVSKVKNENQLRLDEALEKVRVVSNKEDKNEKPEVEVLDDFSEFEENINDEEEAIISYEELKNSKSFGYTDEEMDKYVDEKDAIISIQELEKLYLESQNIEVPKDESPKVEFEMKKVEDLPKIADKNNFQTSPYISPVYGMAKTDQDIMLEQTANLEKLNEEIKKTNEFLKTLKDLKKNLE